jgi:hypothetical protein
MVATMYSFTRNSGSAAIRNVLSNTSWFRGTPYYWAEASLPFAYALVCVEVVSESSEKARILYNLLEAEMPKFITIEQTSA